MKTEEEVKRELEFQREKLKSHTIGSSVYLEILNIVNTLEWVLKER